MSTSPRPASGARRAVAVVGAAGFIGKHLVRRLIADGQDVVRLTRSRPAHVAGALDPDVPGVATVFHVAGSTNPATAEAEPDRAALEVIDFGHLLNGLAALADPPRVVLASSGGTVYAADAMPPYAEDSPVAPTTVYGAARLEMEQLLASYQSSRQSVALRLANVYGPGQRVGTGQGVIGHWIAAALAGAPLDIYGDPQASRDYLYADDAVAAMVAVHGSREPLPTVINIGSGEATSLATLADILRDIVGEDAVSVRLKPSRSVDRRQVRLDVGLAARVLGWAPRVALPEGVRRTWLASLP